MIPGGTNAGDHRTSEPLVEANDHVRRAIIAAAGDLPQLEQPDETAAVIHGFLAWSGAMPG